MSRTAATLFRRLWQAIAMFLRSAVGGRARLLLVTLLILMCCTNGLNVGNSFVARHFMSAIERRESDGFILYAWMYAGVFALSTLTAVFFRFTEERLGLLWREWLTRRVVRLYIERRVFLHLDGPGAITNPDQRIAEDVRALTATTLSFVLMFLSSSITVVSFSGVLWAISPGLFLVSISYAALGSIVTLFLGRPLIRLNYQQSDYEANFRSGLIELREDGPAISANGTEQVAGDQLMERIDRLTANLRRIIAVNRNMSFFTTGYNYMIQLIPILIAAPIFIQRGEDFGIIGQSAMAFATLVGALSLIVTQFQSISSYSVVVTRLNELVEVVESMQGEGSINQEAPDALRPLS